MRSRRRRATGESNVGKLQGKVAIVTGASQGSGYGAAIAMAREGAAIVLVSRTRAKLEAVAAEIAAFSVVRA